MLPKGQVDELEHKELVECVKDHDGRIKKLEISEATTSVKIGGLIKVLWSLVVAIFAQLSAFFFWYVQTLGGK